MAGEYDSIDVPEIASSLHVSVLTRDVGLEIHRDQVCAARPGDHAYGATINLPAGQTATLVSRTVAAGKVLRVWGLKGGGTGDGRFSLEINGAEAYFDVLSIVRPAPEFILPAPHEVPEGVVVALKVMNTSAALADYQGVLLGD